ncbi:pectate lyase [Dactylosporangium sp. NPDC000244]|uniref:pectate lyase n=1 Tax=Dactylosporangium sp. NPDC000244 TaxID=3154365 RepID=UPI00332841FA
MDTRPRRRRWPIVAAGVAAFTASAAIFSQIAFAATLFSDNFEDGDLSGWSKSGGTWAVVSDGSKALNQSNSGSENAREFAGDTGWTNYTVSARVKPTSLASNGFAGLLARATGSTTFYRLALVPGSVQLQAVNSGSVTVLGQVSRTVSTGTWYTLSLTVSGSTISGSVDGASVGSGSSSVASSGRIGVQTAYAAASFDDIAVSDTAGPTPTTTGPTPTKSPTPTPTPTSGGGGGSTPTGSWPSSTGSVSVSGTVKVSSSLDGGMKRYCCIGDGGQSESQDPMFELSDGATLKNVIIGSPAGDGVHCLGRCTIQNVWWEDVGEDAATFLGTSGGDSYVIGGGARSATDKVFQHNGNGTVHISGFYASDIGKLYRGCGNCTNHYERHVTVDNVLLNKAKYVVGINTNWGDTATLTRVTVQSSSGIHICAEYTGVAKGSEPKYLGDGMGDGHCNFKSSDITYK